MRIKTRTVTRNTDNILKSDFTSVKLHSLWLVMSLKSYTDMNRSISLHTSAKTLLNTAESLLKLRTSGLESRPASLLSASGVVPNAPRDELTPAPLVGFPPAQTETLCNSC